VILTDLLALCAIEAASLAPPRDACLLWLWMPSPSGPRPIRTMLIPAQRGRPSPAHLAPALRELADLARPLLRPADRASADPIAATLDLMPAAATPIGEPEAVAVLVPSLPMPVIEAASRNGQAIEAPFIPDAVNAGLAARPLPIASSLAASILWTAARSAQARLS
jgi:hypothetical protein